MHKASFESYITYWVPHNSPRAPLNFPLPQLIPKIGKTIKERPRRKKKKTMENEQLYNTTNKVA